MSSSQPCRVLFTQCARLTGRRFGTFSCLFISLHLSDICRAKSCHFSQGFTQMSLSQLELPLSPVVRAIFCAFPPTAPPRFFPSHELPCHLSWYIISISKRKMSSRQNSDISVLISVTFNFKSICYMMKAQSSSKDKIC